MNKKFYITTPIYYVNDIPHIGHAYTTIVADVLARYYRQKLGSENVFFSTGTDEHGAKIAEAAQKAKETELKFCDSLMLKFQKTWENLNISNDAFIRTTNPEHEKIAQDFLSKLKEKGLIDKRKYEGLYCIGCEKFLTKSELKDNYCSDHPGKKLIKHSEENWYFKLSKFQKPLLQAIEKNDYQILPESRKNEVVSKLKMGPEDISISRAKVPWGIQIPWDKKQTVYVWIEALINYYSVLCINKKLDFWPPTVHLMAKDILWFHAVIWPAMLLALDLELPKKIFAHGFFTINDQKMSKTVGNVIDPNDWIKKYGADAVRIFLLSEFPFGEDGDVSEKKFENFYNNELANNLGNLLNRIIKMSQKHQIKHSLKKQRKLLNRFEEQIEKLNFHQVLINIFLLLSQMNKNIEENQPWKMANDGCRRYLKDKMNELTDINEVLQFFMPSIAQKIKTQLKTLKPEPLFPRIK